jgi:DNA replication and repair protein RecF
VILSELRAENLRNISELVLHPQTGVNLLTGANGAGKTSVLEAVYLLSHASSFRTRRGEILVQRNRERLSIFGEVRQSSGSTARLGLIQECGRWIAKVDGLTPVSLSALLERCAVVCFEPGSHALISGASEERRRFLDWGVFHVEPAFVDIARRYRRALRQRNAALRERSGDPELSIWDGELAAAAIPLSAARTRYMDRFVPILGGLLARYLPELGGTEVRASQAGRPARIWYRS